MLSKAFMIWMECLARLQFQSDNVWCSVLNHIEIVNVDSPNKINSNFHKSIAAHLLFICGVNVHWICKNVCTIRQVRPHYSFDIRKVASIPDSGNPEAYLILFTFQFIGTIVAHSTKWTFIRMDFYHLWQTFIHRIKQSNNQGVMICFGISLFFCVFFFHHRQLEYFVNALLWTKSQKSKCRNKIGNSRRESWATKKQKYETHIKFYQ